MRRIPSLSPPRRSAPFVLAAAFAALASLGPGCAGSEESVGDLAASLVDGQPDAIGVLTFLNDPSTTFELLNQEVPLDRRAAEGLIENRPFSSIDEVAAVYWVGPVALERLLAYAGAHGWIPEGDDLLGVYDGVAFTVAEAEATLRVANVSPEATLRHEIPLQSRTATSIVDARPIKSVLALSQVRYVGPVSLERLRSYALASAPPVACSTDAECPSGSRCESQGAGDGVCRHDDELLGVYSGVSFTVGDAAASLVLVNRGDTSLLRAEVGLSARATENLLAARPLDSIEALDAVPWVGPASLTSVRDFARSHPEIIAALAGEPGPCKSSSQCDGDLVCAGIPQWGPPGEGTCRHPDDLPGPGFECIPEDPACSEGYFCAGLSLGYEWGYCSPMWMSATHPLGGLTVAPGEKETWTIQVSGLASVPLDVVVGLSSNQSSPPLVLTLENPYETVVPVWPHPYWGPAPLGGYHVVFTPGDEAVNGTWRLHVENQGDAPVSLGEGSIYFSSRWD